MVHGGGKAEAHVLIVRRVDGVNHIGGIAMEEVGVLLVVHQEEVNVPAFIGGLDPGNFRERVVSPVELRAGCVRRNFEEKFCGGGDGERFMDDDGAGSDGRWSNVVVGMRLPWPPRLFFGRLLRGVGLRHILGERADHWSYNRVYRALLRPWLGGLRLPGGWRFQQGRVIVVISDGSY